MPTPTLGATLLYRPRVDAHSCEGAVYDQNQPFSATVTNVHPGDQYVDALVRDHADNYHIKHYVAMAENDALPKRGECYWPAE